VTDEFMLPAIAHVKAGRLAEAGPPMARAVRSLLAGGADVVILACTEAPLALAAAAGDTDSLCVDSTMSLARSTVALWRSQNTST
jgi:aspartate racemase